MIEGLEYRLCGEVGKKSNYCHEEGSSYMENRLKEVCLSNPEMKEKYYMYCQVKNELTERLRTVPAYFPHFSLHDGTHSANIIKHLCLLLGKDAVQQLSASDIFVICVAAYAHDISMSVSYEMIYDKMTSSEWENKLKKYTKSEQEDFANIAERLLRFPEIQDDMDALDVYADILYIIEETFRSEHAERSAKEIANNESLEKLFGIRIRNILSEVCRLHGCKTSDIMGLPYEENGLFDDYIHPRFDAALLALGDLLDMDTDRFDKEFLKVATPMLNLSKVHKCKHESITHFLVKDGKIEIKSNCNALEVYRAMRDWIDWIKQITEFLSINWSRIAPNSISNVPSLNDYEVLLNNDTKWIEFVDLKFEISSKHALKLLAGTDLYRSKYVFVRELIQNAVDATMIRIYSQYLEQEQNADSDKFLQWLMKNTQEIEKLAINATISIEDKKVKFVIEDKGIGISKVALKRIANVEGKSESERELIESMPEFFRPSGTFGIGIQSVFAVADHFEIITRTESESTKKIIFHDVKDGRGYINVSDGDKRSSIGTTVIVYLNPYYFNQEDIGVNDYIYKVQPKEEIIYRSFISNINNVSIDVPPFILMEQKCKEYIPTKIKKEDVQLVTHMPQTILEYKNLFEDEVFQKENYLDITFENKGLRYKYYDVEKCCVFNVVLYTGHKEGQVLESTKELTSHYVFGNTIFYRNSFVKSDYEHRPKYATDRFYSYMDYSINLLSGSSDEILTLERKGIKDSFRRQLNELIDIEITKFICQTVDYLLEKEEEISESLLFMIYQEARQQEYKYQELSEKYINKFKGLKIAGYVNLKNIEKTFSAYELMNKKLYLARKYQDEETTEVWNNLEPRLLGGKAIEEKELLDMNAKGSSLHPLNHRIKECFMYSLDKTLYEIYVAEPYLKQNHEPYERDDFLKRELFLQVLFGNRRCIPAWPDFRNLQTYINLRVSYHSSYLDMQVEMALDLTIKDEISNELQLNGYILDCTTRYLERIIKSETYNINMQYILNECEMCKESIRELYQKFWEEQLSLFEDERNSKLIKQQIKEIKERIRKDQLRIDREVYGGYFSK